MADIKTRDTVKGTIKTLDKAAIAGQKMKQAYIATKDKAEHSVNAKENTAEEYAADKTEAGIDEIAHKGAYAFNKAGRKGVQETKKNIQSAKDGIQRFKQQRAEKSINVQRAQGRTTTVGSSSAQTQTSSAIKTLEKPEKMVKQSATSAGKKNIKLRIETALCCLHGVKSPTAAFLHHHSLNQFHIFGNTILFCILSYQWVVCFHLCTYLRISIAFTSATKHCNSTSK